MRWTDLNRPASAALTIALVVTLLAVPAARGQQLPEDSYNVGVQVSPGTGQIPVNGQMTFQVNATDKSFTNEETLPRTGPNQRNIQLQVEIVAPQNESIVGWSASLTKSRDQVGPGDSVVTTLQVSASPVASPNLVIAEINVSMEVAGQTAYNSASIPIRLEPFRRVSLQINEAPPRLGPNEVAYYSMTLTNVGNYPDTMLLDVVDSGNLQIGMRSAVALEPKQSIPFEISIVAPESFYEYGSTQLVTLEASSANNPESTYTASIPVQISGFYLPTWTFPFWVLLVALAAYGGQRTYEKVKRDRRRYGHPAPKYTEEQKEKLKELKERDKEKYKAVKERLDQRYKEQLEAYKERKRKGKARRTGALLAKMEAKRKEQEKLRKSGLKTVKKLKKKDASPEEIYQALDEDEREQLGDDLPEMLTAATAAGAVLAARDEDEEMGTVDKMRAKKAETERKRLRAEALMLIEHRREEGYDPEEIRDELSESQKLALGDDLEFALEGES